MTANAMMLVQLGVLPVLGPVLSTGANHENNKNIEFEGPWWERGVVFSKRPGEHCNTIRIPVENGTFQEVSALKDV